jgi:hypothetical protein
VDDGLLPDLIGDATSLFMPFGGSVGKRVAGLLLAEWKRNSSSALQAAERVSGLSREDFVDWIGREPRAVPLYLTVLWAAGMNGHDQTLRAMGAVFGQAAKAAARTDDAAFEDAELALGAMAGLLPRHFLVLAQIERGVVVRPDGSENYIEVTPDFVGNQVGLTEDIAHQCLLNLAAAGLVVSKPVLEATAYPITDIGRAVLDAARQVAPPTDE